MSVASTLCVRVDDWWVCESGGLVSERVNVRVGVPTNLCVKESWSECALESLRGSGVSVFAPLCVRMDG